MSRFRMRSGPVSRPGSLLRRVKQPEVVLHALDRNVGAPPLRALLDPRAEKPLSRCTSGFDRVRHETLAGGQRGENIATTVDDAGVIFKIDDGSRQSTITLFFGLFRLTDLVSPDCFSLQG